MNGFRSFLSRLTIAICEFAACLYVCAQFAAAQGSPPAAQQGNDAAAASQTGEFKIQVGVNSVLVPVVVRDAHGVAIGDLTQKDFFLFDQDKPQPISGFSVLRRATNSSTPVTSAKPPNSAAPTSATSPSSPAATSPQPATPERFIVFLFDDLHFEPGDLLRIKRVATKMLGETIGASDMAAIVTTSGASSGLTRDRMVLEAAVEKITAHPLYQHDSHACPNIGVYEADLIVNKHNVQALEAAEAAYSTCAHVGGPESSTGAGNSQMGGLGAGEDMSARMIRSAAAQVMELGDRDVAVTLSSAKEFVRRLGKLPGQHTMILVSPGFVTVTPNSMREKSELLDLAARDNVTISALDARGLYTTNLDASQRGGDSARDLMTGESLQYHSETMNFSEDVMAELANGSGGTFFHNSNDLEGGFKQLAQAPEYVYLLELSLDHVKPDGVYHRLKVKVDRDATKVEARRGYFAPHLPAKHKR